MTAKRSNQPEVNFLRKSIETFIEYYNRNIPESFPHATPDALEKFQAAYPTLFKGSRKWVIDKHRKKLMDWLASHRD